MIRCVSAAVLRPLPVVLLFLASALPISAQSLTTPWSSRDIGSPYLQGAAFAMSTATDAAGAATTSETAADGFQIVAAGTDIWGTADQFHFAYQAVTGDVDVRARVDDVMDVHPWAKAGVMIRASLAAGAAHGYALSSAEKGVAFQWRATASGLTDNASGETAAPPRWVRLVRQGTQLTAYSSADGVSWTKLGTKTIALGATAYVGVAVTSHNETLRTSARVSNVTVTPLTVALTMRNTDIGAPVVRGSVTAQSGSYTIKGAGEDIWSTADQFHYLYEEMTGDGSVVARVSSIRYTDSWAKAGVMIRETLDADSAHASMFLSAGRGYAFQRRVATGMFSDNTSGGSGVAPGWVRLDRRGSTFTAYRSADGVTWKSIGSAAINMSSTVYVGMAVTSHNSGVATDATVSGYRMTEFGTTANKPPVVALTAPAAGSSYLAPASIAVSANAGDPEGRLSAVEFYSGNTLIGRDTTAPYAMTWQNVPAGAYSLKAVAIDAEGASATSAAVAVTVTSVVTTGAPRIVEFTASVDHATKVTSYLLEIFAAGVDPNTAKAVAQSNLGKPTPDKYGKISLDRSTFFSALKSGSYQATVTAIGPDGKGRTDPVPFTR